MAMRYVTVGLAAIILQWGVAHSASATPPQGFYVGAAIGFAWVDDATYDLLGAAVIPHPTDFDDGHAFSVVGGYGFSGPRLELELAHRENDVDGFGRLGDMGPGKGDISADSAMMNLLYDFDLDRKFIPFLGAGLGWANVEADGIRKDVTAPDRTGNVDGDDTVFGYQLIAGISYQATEQLGITLEYHYLEANDAKFGYGTGCTPAGTECIVTSTLEEDYESQTLSLGIRWSF